LLVKKKADLGGDRVKESHAYYGNEGWTVQLKFDGDGAKQSANHRTIQRAPLCDRARRSDSIRAGDSRCDLWRRRHYHGKFEEKEARGLASVLENPLQTPVSIEEERSVSPTLGLDSIRASIMAGLLGLQSRWRAY